MLNDFTIKAYINNLRLLGFSNVEFLELDCINRDGKSYYLKFTHFDFDFYTFLPDFSPDEFTFEEVILSSVENHVRSYEESLDNSSSFLTFARIQLMAMACFEKKEELAFDAVKISSFAKTIMDKYSRVDNFMDNLSYICLDDIIDGHNTTIFY